MSHHPGGGGRAAGGGGARAGGGRRDGRVPHLSTKVARPAGGRLAGSLYVRLPLRLIRGPPFLSGLRGHFWKC